MANKARFHKFKRITGHRPDGEQLILPANSQHDIKKMLETESVKIEFIQSNIWKEVKILPEGIKRAFFYTEDGFEFHDQDMGFEYLKAQFQKEYDEVIKDTIPSDD